MQDIFIQQKIVIVCYSSANINKVVAKKHMTDKQKGALFKNNKPCPSEWEIALLPLVWDTKSILFQPCTYDMMKINLFHFNLIIDLTSYLLPPFSIITLIIIENRAL